MCVCQCTCLLVAGALLVAAFVFRYVVVRGKQCTSQARLDGKTVIVTGELRNIQRTNQNKQNRIIYKCCLSSAGTVLFELDMINRKKL